MGFEEFFDVNILFMSISWSVFYVWAFTLRKRDFSLLRQKEKCIFDEEKQTVPSFPLKILKSNKSSLPINACGQGKDLQIAIRKIPALNRGH